LNLQYLALSSVLKTIAKPLASRLKLEAGRSQTFRTGCVSFGQISHYVNTRVNVIASGYKFIGVKPLPEEEALQLGVASLSEVIVMGLGAAIVIVEVQVYYA